MTGKTAAVNKYEIRRPRADDAAAIHAMVARYNAEVIGMADMTLDDVADQLADPGFDPERDGWLLSEPGGQPVGWAWVCRKGISDNIDVEVLTRHPGAADLLWDAVIERAQRIGAELGHERVRADIGIYRQDDAARAAAKARGFAPATSYHRLYIEHGGGARPAFLPGVTVHRGADDEQALVAAHRIHEEGFAEHFGHVPRGFDEWVRDVESSATSDWSQLIVAKVHGEPAAMLLGSDMFVSDENCGYVRNLAVLPRFRGSGLGRLLLRHAFAEDERRGRRGTYLHVDANNTTPALGLYLSVGMREVMAIDVWRAVL